MPRHYRKKLRSDPSWSGVLKSVGLKNFFLLAAVVALFFTYQSIAIDKGDFTGVAPELQTQIFQSFDGKGYYLTDEQGNTVANKWTQTSKIETPPSFTATIDGRYVIVFLKNESAQTYAEYWHHVFGVKSIIREAGLPQIFEKLHATATATNVVVEPDLVITESRKITPIEPIYFKDAVNQKPYTIEVNSKTFTPCFLLKEDADLFIEKITRENKRNYIPVVSKFKDFLRFVEGEVEVERNVRVFGPPAEERLQQYIKSLQSASAKSE